MVAWTAVIGDGQNWLDSGCVLERGGLVDLLMNIM